MEHIKAGDKVKIICQDLAIINNSSNQQKVFIGIVQNVFNAVDNIGDNYFFEVKNGTSWFLYKPRIDGGTIQILEAK